MITKIFWLSVITLETVGAGLFFRVALAKKVPSEVIRCAWILGGCLLVFTLMIVFEKFYPKKDR